MRKEGTIVRWDDIKGFGFIRSPALAQDVFLHVRDYRAQAGGAPRQGLRVTFEEIHVGGKGPRAVAVQPIATRAGNAVETVRGPRAVPAPARSRNQQAHRGRRAPKSGAWWALPLMVGYALGLMWLVWQRQAPWWAIPASFLLNLATFFAYWQDKYAAEQGLWRVPEKTLHFWSLAGGWGGAWFAQQVLRHKCAKEAFRSTYHVTVVLHCAGAIALWWWFPVH